MENITQLRDLVCLLSCQPRNAETQLPEALDCLRSALNVKAVGVIWPDAAGRLREMTQSPKHFELPSHLQSKCNEPGELSTPRWGCNGQAWLLAPLKVSGVTVGRLWAVDDAQRIFSQADLEFAMMLGNQLALALENARLYADVERLASRRAELLRRVTATQDERCRRIARDLHDEISQSLAALALDMEALQVAELNPQRKFIERIDDFHPRVLDILQEINRIILDLRPTLLEDLGLAPALEWLAHKRLSSANVQIVVSSHPADLRLPPELETPLYRIGQEAISNIAKHAHAQTVYMELELVGDSVSLTVQDDGQGFELDAVLSNADDRIGLGIFGMKERTSLIGGDFLIQSEPGRGTRIAVTIPLT